MNSSFNIQIARDRSLKLRDQARIESTVARAAHQHQREVEIRFATPADDSAVRRLAELEGAEMPPGPALVAVVEDVILAATAVSGGLMIADPFQPTAWLIDPLRQARARVEGWSGGGRRALGLRRLLRRFRDDQNGAARSAGAPMVPGSERLLIR